MPSFFSKQNLGIIAVGMAVGAVSAITWFLPEGISVLFPGLRGDDRFGFVLYAPGFIFGLATALLYVGKFALRSVIAAIFMSFTGALCFGGVVFLIGWLAFADVYDGGSVSESIFTAALVIMLSTGLFVSLLTSIKRFSLKVWGYLCLWGGVAGALAWGSMFVLPYVFWDTGFASLGNFKETLIQMFPIFIWQALMFPAIAWARGK